MNRRTLLQAVAALGAAAALPGVAPGYAQTGLAPLEPTSNGERVFDFIVDDWPLTLSGRTGSAMVINGSMPGPLLRAREGETIVVRLRNRLKESTSIHWHGLLIPNAMDGVPGVTFRGIDPGQTFVYRLPIKQNGTYWYHSHSGLQEQLGLYGPLLVTITFSSRPVWLPLPRGGRGCVWTRRTSPTSRPTRTRF
jgi:FtsP/CotA-like multicopper oxidase with cupredoxin domain